MNIPDTTRRNFIASTLALGVLPRIGLTAEAERYDICVYGGKARLLCSYRRAQSLARWYDRGRLEPCRLGT